MTAQKKKSNRDGYRKKEEKGEKEERKREREKKDFFIKTIFMSPMNPLSGCQIFILWTSHLRILDITFLGFFKFICKTKGWIV